MTLMPFFTLLHLKSLQIQAGRGGVYRPGSDNQAPEYNQTRSNGDS
jgi:hypothetical protein